MDEKTPTNTKRIPETLDEWSKETPQEARPLITGGYYQKVYTHTIHETATQEREYKTIIQTSGSGYRNGPQKHTVLVYEDVHEKNSDKRDCIVEREQTFGKAIPIEEDEQQSNEAQQNAEIEAEQVAHVKMKQIVTEDNK